MSQPVSLETGSRMLDEWLATSPLPKEQKAALDHYGKFFTPSNIDQITKEEFKQFLLFSNNKHWSGIHRQQERVTADMPRLHQALHILLDESQSIENRLQALRPKGKPGYVEGLGKAILTPILMCVYPDKYIVYNNITESALSLLGMFPCSGNESFATRYVAVNDVCNKISTKLEKPLYLVDSMFSLLIHGPESPLNGPESSTPTPTTSVEDAPLKDQRLPATPAAPFSFSLEQLLEQFLVENWTNTPLGVKYRLHEEDGDVAEQYQTDVGRIDIVGRDRLDNAWVVIELKRGKSSDQVVGQLLRYMGWIKKHKAKRDEEVRGIIITGEPDDRIKYAMLVAQGVSFYCYKVHFDLQQQEFLG